MYFTTNPNVVCRQVLAKMKDRNVCKWYDETSGMKRAYDKGLLDKKWIEEYCWNGGKGCASPS